MKNDSCWRSTDARYSLFRHEKRAPRRPFFMPARSQARAMPCLCSQADLQATMERMAALVDQQNAGDKLYRKMHGNFKKSAAFQAASDLVFKGVEQPSGYTEPLLHAWRQKVKAGA